jgi:hypothetical protein
MTTTVERCELTDLIVGQCAHCCGHVLDVDAGGDLETTGPRFTARYGGTCASCKEPFEAGVTRIQALADQVGYACEECLP